MTDSLDHSAAVSGNEKSLDEVVHRLRSIAGAYPADVFLPLDAEDRKHPLTIQRASAAMGRHMAPLLLDAAECIELAQWLTRKLTQAPETPLWLASHEIAPWHIGYRAGFIAATTTGGGAAEDHS